MQEKYPCYYPGEFAPPTKMHLNTLYWLLNKPEVGHVHVVIGKDDGGPISQQQKAEMWDILLKSSFAPQASVLKAKTNGPVSEIYSMLEAKSTMPLFIALDESAARNKKLQKKFDKFPHYGMQLIPSQFHKSSQALMQAVQNDDKPAMKAELPDDFSDAQVDEYMSILKRPSSEEEPVEEKSPLINYKEEYVQKFNDGFWKSVFEPISGTE